LTTNFEVPSKKPVELGNLGWEIDDSMETKVTWTKAIQPRKLWPQKCLWRNQQKAEWNKE